MTVRTSQCVTMCEAAQEWESLPLYDVFDIAETQANPRPLFSGMHEYLKSLRQDQGWNPSTWSSGDPRRIRECNYLCRISNAFVDKNGHVCVMSDTSGTVCFAQEQCAPRPNVAVTVPCNVTGVPRYKSVLVISQVWGAAVFHGLVENAIKLGDTVRLLQSHPDIYVHVPSPTGMVPAMLKAFDIDASRLIHGPVAADTLFYPRGTNCGSPSTRQLLKFRDVLKTTTCYRQRHRNQSTNGPAILLVSRKAGTPRAIANHAELRKHLELLAESRGYVFKEFSPPAPPREKCSVVDDMLTFQNSKVIVAAHGAGLTNILLSDPGTIIVEIQPAITSKHVNLCFAGISMKLGLRHFVQFDKNGSRSSPLAANVSEIIDFISHKI